MVTGVLVSTLALNRIGASGAVKPVAGLQIGQGSAVVLDEISSTDVAAAVAEMADMIVADQVMAEAEALALGSELASATEDQLVKPQMVTTEVTSREDIVKHVVADGETLDAIAKQYNITTDTIKWANNLTTNRVSPGTELTILPINGVLHTVADGETPGSIARKYRANASQIVAFNDAEVSGLVPGQQIVIPDGVKSAPRTLFNLGNYRLYSSSWSFLGRYTKYGLSSGWCTNWARYRANQLGNYMPNNLGNARSWNDNIGSSRVHRKPIVGAVAQRGNHVAVVEAVSEDGSMVKISDMNGVGGWGNAVLYNDWFPIGSYEYYLY